MHPRDICRNRRRKDNDRKDREDRGSGRTDIGADIPGTATGGSFGYPACLYPGSVCAGGEDRAYGETLWQEISRSEGLLQELAYYHDYGEFLCRYQVAGYTLADVLVWQVDHFKLYMDRPQDMNRYRRQRLLLSAFHTLARMEEEPTALMNFMDKMQGETGQDIP